MEEQAIARAVRMGQRRTVTIYRYVVDKSVENVSGVMFQRACRENLTGFQNIVNMQRRKRNLAKYTLDAASGEGSCSGLDVRFPDR